MKQDYMNVHTDVIKTIKDLRLEFSPIVNTNDALKSHLTKTDKVALFIVKKVGTMGFFYACLVLAATPLIFPTTLPVIQYISSGFLQLIFLPLIMVGQNLQGRHAELRAQHDYETNIKAEKEVEIILLHLEKQHELMLDMVKKIEKLESERK